MAFLSLTKSEYQQLVELLILHPKLTTILTRQLLLTDAGLDRFIGSVSLDLATRAYVPALILALHRGENPLGTDDPPLVLFIRTARQEFEGQADAIDFIDRLLAQPYTTEEDADWIPTSLNKRDPAERLLLSKVRDFWVDTILEKNAPQPARIELQKRLLPELVREPFEHLMPSEEVPEMVPPETTILEIFEQHQRELLITGAPGAGKTITLLTLARALIVQAEQNETEPIPLLFNLASWGEKRSPLLEWLTEEIAVQYHVARKDGRQWLQTGKILLLLDGLDEVQETEGAACIHAINQYLQDSSHTGIVVCCRLGDYKTLATPLHLSGAVELLPLTLQEVDQYLAQKGAQSQSLRSLLPQDPALAEMVASPLMLHIVGEVYGSDVPPVTLSDAHEAPETRVRTLFNAYIWKMFNLRGRTQPTQLSPAYTIERLAWLASQLNQQGQKRTVFLIEGIQPSWLDTMGGRWVYAFASRFLGAFIIFAVGLLIIFGEGLFTISFSEVIPYLIPVVNLVLGSMLVSGGTMGVLAGIHFTRKRNALPANRTLIRLIRSFVGAALSAGIPFALFIIAAISYLGNGATLFLPGMVGVLVAMSIFVIFTGFSGLPFGLTFGLRTNAADVGSDILIVEALRFSRQGALRGMVIGGLITSVITLLFMLLGLFSIILQSILLGDVSSEAFRDSLVLNFLIFVATGLPFIYFGATLGMLLNSIQTMPITAKSRPNEGVKQSVANAAKSFLLYFVGGIPIVVGTWLGFQAGEGLARSGVTEILGPDSNAGAALFWWLLAFGTLGALYNGGLAVIQHYLLRLVLAGYKRLPWKLTAFLEQATDVNLLQRVGGGYQFFHPLLQEHFATLTAQERETILKMKSPHAL